SARRARIRRNRRTLRRLDGACQGRGNAHRDSLRATGPQLDAGHGPALPSAHLHVTAPQRARVHACHRCTPRGDAMKYNRISADCHLDLIWLPPDLFVSEAPRELKDKMPYVADGPDGRQWVANNGAKFGLAGGVGASGTKHVPGKQLRVDVMASTRLHDDGKQGIRRPGDPHLRIKEMDRDGVDAEVIYGILAAAAKLKDIEASNEMVRIYNTW